MVSVPDTATETGVRGLPTAHLFGLPITVVDCLEASRLVLEWADAAPARVVVTPNTDHFLRWQRNAGFRNLYSGADLALVDGAPLALLARLEGIAVSRFTGAALFFDMAKKASADHVPLIIVGGLPGVAQRAARRLEQRYPGLTVPFVTSPSNDDLTSDEWLRGLAAQLRRHPRKIVALCVGSPKQEALFRALQRVDPELSGVYLCVGAAVDYAAGTLRRAPGVMQLLGLEWVFRLLVEPRRLWRRYLANAVGILRFLLLAAIRSCVRRGATTPLDR